MCVGACVHLMFLKGFWRTPVEKLLEGMVNASQEGRQPFRSVAGEKVLEHSGANTQKLESGLLSVLKPEENPLEGANPFQIQIWHSRIGL